LSFDDLLQGLENGYAVVGGELSPNDTQQNAIGRNAIVYQVEHGKLTRVHAPTLYMINTTNLWKNLVALGGRQSLRIRGFSASKGNPRQSAVQSIETVPARFQNVVLRRVER
jgi:predicted Zn-dependent protease